MKLPGNDYFYTLCDICGKKIRASEGTIVRDPYNFQHNLLVCKDDKDVTNPQMFLKGKPEKPISHPELVRSEGTDREVFISSAAEIETGDASNPNVRTPDAPQLLFIEEVTSSSVKLKWFAPNYQGGVFGVVGYIIERESPVGGGFSEVETTNTQNTYYTDTTVSANTQYNYRVSAVVSSGSVGADSNMAAVRTGS